jgi:hypothetical protein
MTLAAPWAIACIAVSVKTAPTSQASHFRSMNLLVIKIMLSSLQHYQTKYNGCL